MATVPRSLTLFWRVSALCVLALIAVSPAPARAQSASGIAATVNDDVISYYDLQARIWMIIASSRMENTPETRKRLIKPILHELIDEKLMMQEAARQKITVSPAEIDEAMTRLEQHNHMPPGGLKTFMKANHIDRTTLASKLEAEIAWAKATRRKLSSEITVSPDEVNDRLAQLKAQTGRMERHLGEIYLPVDSPQREPEVRDLANRLFQQLQKTHNFGQVARNFSRSPDAAAGGDMGWVPQGQLEPALETALSKMKPNELSAPIRTLSGYYILVYLGQRRDPGLSDTANEVVSLQQIFMPLAEDAPAATVSSQMALAAKVAKNAHSCKDMARLGAESASQLSGNLGKIKLSSLPDNLRAAVADLPDGKPSKPVRTKTGVAVLMVCSREGVDKTDPREKIRRALFEQRLNAAADQYLRDLRRRAFVDVRL